MSKNILIMMIVGSVNLIVGSLFLYLAIKREEKMKNEKKIAKKFFAFSHQTLLMFAIVGTIFFILSAVGIFAGCLFAFGALTAFCFEKILMRFECDNTFTHGEINTATGTLISGFALMLLSILLVFPNNLIMAFSYLLGIALSTFLFEIHNRIFIESAGNLIAGMKKNIDMFIQRNRVLEIILLSALVIMITGSQSLSGAIIPVALLSLSAIIFLLNLIAWKIIKKFSLNLFKKSLFTIASIGLIAGSFGIIKRMGVPLNIFWSFASGIVLAIILYMFAKKLKSTTRFMTFAGSIYLIAGFAFKFGGIYSLATFVMGFVILSSMITLCLEDVPKILLDSAYALGAVILFMFLVNSLNLFAIDLSIGRVIFGLMSGTTAVIAVSVAFKELINKGLDKSKEELPRTRKGNYKKLIQKVAVIAIEGVSVVSLLAIVLPIIILLILGIQSFVAFIVGTVMFSVPFLLAKEKSSAEILSAVCLLCILTIVLMPIIK